MSRIEEWRQLNELPPIEQAVKAFEEQALNSPELAREAFWRLLDNVKECQRKVNRSLILMAAFALVFELFHRGLVSEVSVGGLKLANLESLTFTLPVVIGFEAFSALSAIRDRNVMISGYARLSEAVYPNLHRSNIDALLITPSGFITSIFPSVYINSEAFRISSSVSVLEYIAFAFLLPIGLPGYTLVQLFGQTGFATWEPWIAATLVFVFLVIGYSSVFTMRTEE